MGEPDRPASKLTRRGVFATLAGELVWSKNLVRIDFRTAFRGEIYRRSHLGLGRVATSEPIGGRVSQPWWRRILRAPFSLMRRFLVGGVHLKLDELTVKTDDLQARISIINEEIRVLRALVGDRLHQLDIKVRGPHEYDEHSVAVRFNDGYVLVPKMAKKLRILLADAPAEGLEPGTCRVIKKLLTEGMTAIDIGANVGSLTLACARAVGHTGKVYAFEPEPIYATLLREMLELNGISWVELQSLAISRSNGAATFHVSPIGGHSSLYELPYEERAHQLDVEVQTSKLDDALPSTHGIDLIKMDVEGAELDVLAGMPSIIKANPELTIIAEFGSSHLANQNISTDNWVDSFVSLGFSLFAIDEISGHCEPASVDELKGKQSVNVVMARFGTRAHKILVEAI